MIGSDGDVFKEEAETYQYRYTRRPRARAAIIR
jgi:hypothetical protein